ncbi:MAG TPA: GGDEF domain-containing protein [Burkholderiales bacterium]|nr:GGDEF domain-containing protein [Burkholderiales bacterium]
MIEPEERLDEALRAARALERDQHRRRRWVFGTAGSYAVDTAFLALFALVGTIHATVPVAYGTGAVLICVAQYALIARGWNLRARDPNLTEIFIMLGIAMNLGVVAAAPQIAFPFLANQFTVFAFGMMWLSLRDSIVVWTLGAIAFGAVLLANGGTMGVPSATRYEAFLTWAYFAVVMGRCLVLSVYAAEMRARLAESRRRLAASYEQAKVLASHDELTHALNRRSLMAALERERNRAERSSQPFSVAILDLDHFKSVNDTLGHAAGDAVLKEFARVAGETKRTTDVFGRFGGEEFLLILVDIDCSHGLQATERVRMAVEAIDWSTTAPGLKVTVSAGVACYRKGETIEQLLHRADTALYEAKRAGRNQVKAEQ